MNEEQTDRFEGGTPFEIRVLRELANLNRRFDGLESLIGGLEVRLTSLEDKVEARLHDTRPIWESVLSRLDSMDTRLNGIETRLERIDDKFEVVADELLDMRTEIKTVKKRLPAA
jgi:chromosome segregation ATPase